VDLGYYVGEVEKLTSSLNTPKTITIETLRKSISTNISEDIFALSDAVVEGRLAAGLSCLSQLAYHKIFIGRIVSELARTMRNIAYCQGLIAAGKSADEIASTTGIHPFSVKKALASRTYTVQDARQALKAIRTADYYVKNGIFDEQNALEILITDLTEKTFYLARDL